MGLILAQLIHLLQESKQLTIRTDSQLLVQQVKGNAKVKNIRFVKMMPIVHDLAMHFERMNLDWIDREQNNFADKLARSAAIESVGATQQQPDLFSLSFTIKKK
jgi:ribonuclease HI